MTKIGIITGSTREGRVNLDVAKWILEVSKQYDGDATFEIVDIKEYDLPMVDGMPPAMLNRQYPNENVMKFSQKIDELDGFIFVTPEYNKMITPALANALDSIAPEWNNKAAGLVGYGSTLGVTATQSLRIKLSNFQIATVTPFGALSMMTDFENFSVFKPAEHNVGTILNVIKATVSWAKALETVRK